MDSATRAQFLADYAKIRHAEGRASRDSAYYRSLPNCDLTGNNSTQWKIRARSFHFFLRNILAREEQRFGRKLDLLDLGAGNGWMSHQLTSRGHRVVALDIFSDDQDGLGAFSHYPMPISAVVGEFDHPPFRDSSFDLAIFNASFHYSADYARTLTRVRDCLRPSGRLVIIDSPFYEIPEHGERMRAERQAFFEQQYGFRSEALRSIEYLDRAALAQLSHSSDIEWQQYKPWYGIRWALRPWRARLQGRRPPSRFVILVGSFRRP